MLKKNLIANYLGQGWAAFINLAFIPIYIRYLGIESYGLIGVFAVLQAWLSLLDVGMTPALGREMARYSSGGKSIQYIRNLLRSIEYVAIGIALFLSASIWIASDWLARDWLQVEKLPYEIVTQAFAIMGVLVALRFIEGIYRSAIIGLQKQVMFNLANAILATLRAIGAIGVLVWISPTINIFFIWQGFISFLSVIVLAILTYHILPKAERRGVFSVSALYGVGRFAGGMMGITFLGLLLTQIDKILLSKFLPLSEYGRYTLATVIAGSLFVLINPIIQAWFPRLNQLHAGKKYAELVEKYHQGAQLVSVFMGSAAVVMIIYSQLILELWTSDRELARRSATLLSLLALGNLLNGLMWMPYQTQLAHGWTGLAMKMNTACIIFMVPVIFWVTPRFGAEGAAWVWVTLNTCYVLLGIQFMHRRILKNEKWRWYWQDVLRPLLAGLSVALLFCWVMAPDDSNNLKLIKLILASGLTLIASALFSKIILSNLQVQARVILKRIAY